MPVCEWCGKEFDEYEAIEEFEDSTWLLSYEHIKKCLCGKCAIKAIEEQIEGVYIETCEKCGKEFDFIEDSGKFMSYFSSFSGTELRDYWSENRLTLCCDCALDLIDTKDVE